MKISHIILIFLTIIIILIFSLVHRDYFEKFIKQISRGDVTSEQCAAKAKQISREETLGMTESIVYNIPYDYNEEKLSDYFYSYKLKRCLGFYEIYFRNEKGEDTGGLKESVVDIITSQVLVTCSSSHVNKSVMCKDLNGAYFYSWEESKGKIPPMFPIYLNVWKKIKVELMD